MEQIFVTFLVVFALFFANSTTVLVALVAKPLVLPTQWSHLQKIVHKPLESDLNFSKTLLQCSNVTVSCVKYHWMTARLAFQCSNAPQSQCFPNVQTGAVSVWQPHHFEFYKNLTKHLVNTNCVLIFPLYFI